MRPTSSGFVLFPTLQKTCKNISWWHSKYEEQCISMFKKSLAIFIFLACSICVLADDQNANTTTTPAPIPATTASPFGTQIRKTVVFIEAICQDINTTVKVRGTGFFVGVPAEKIGKDKMFNYLVTNRHVAECWDESRKVRPIVSMAAKLNLKTGSVFAGIIDIKQWVLPKDASVDLAIVPVILNENLDFLTIPISLFATKDVVSAKNVAEGARIAFSGFFYQFPGQQKIQPIVREGILAMMPDEPMQTLTGHDGKVYLGDVHIFNGNSGSPVFVNVAQFGEEYRLLGVVSGMFYEDQDFNLQIVSTVTGTQHGNSGIAIIVPVDQVKELLDEPTLVVQREKAVAEALAAAATH